MDASMRYCLPLPSVAVPGVVLMVTVTGTMVSLSLSTHKVNSPSSSLTVIFGRPNLTVTTKKQERSISQCKHKAGIILIKGA